MSKASLLEEEALTATNDKINNEIVLSNKATLQKQTAVASESEAASSTNEDLIWQDFDKSSKTETIVSPATVANIELTSYMEDASLDRDLDLGGKQGRYYILI